MSNLGRILGRVLVRLTLAVVFVAAAISVAGIRLSISATASLAAVTQNLQDEEPLATPSAQPAAQVSGPTVIGEEPTAPDTFGDDDRLDELWQQCDDGWGYACDRLFDEAPIGSDYERFGLSCGNRAAVLHCQIELDDRPENPSAGGWPLPFPLPTIDPAPTPVGGAQSVH